MTSLQLIVAMAGLLLTLIGIIVTLALGVYQMKKKYQWDKIMVVHQLCQAWNERTLPHRRFIEKSYGTYFVGFKPITPPDSEKLVHAVEGDDLFHIKTAVVSLMNYFEDVAVLYSTGIADKHTLDVMLRRPVLRWYDKIKPLALCFDQVAGYPSWKPLDELMEAWKKEDSLSKSVEPNKFP